ncbi:hypothetical protein [Hyphococcus lacteus]|uniref:Uncharacterized protein n=1 Tax=Hyphococcus lacteus TaxID=3143536 RepID=A0ABV3Z3Q6_9PROT
MGYNDASHSTTLWDCLFTLILYGSFIAASTIHKTPEPIFHGLIGIVVITILYYAPLRFINWMRSGDGSIKTKLGVNLPLYILAAYGIMLIFVPMEYQFVIEAQG